MVLGLVVVEYDAELPGGRVHRHAKVGVDSRRLELLFQERADVVVRIRAELLGVEQVLVLRLGVDAGVVEPAVGRILCVALDLLRLLPGAGVLVAFRRELRVKRHLDGVFGGVNRNSPPRERHDGLSAGNRLPHL